jgi:hypothetical protein
MSPNEVKTEMVTPSLGHQCIDRWGDMFKLIIRAFGPEEVAAMYSRGAAEVNEAHGGPDTLTNMRAECFNLNRKGACQ